MGRGFLVSRVGLEVQTRDLKGGRPIRGACLGLIDEELILTWSSCVGGVDSVSFCSNLIEDLKYFL